MKYTQYVKIAVMILQNKLVMALLKRIAKRTDNKIDDKIVDTIEKLINGVPLSEIEIRRIEKACK